jgi:hypothetical protein
MLFSSSLQFLQDRHGAGRQRRRVGSTNVVTPVNSVVNNDVERIVAPGFFLFFQYLIGDMHVCWSQSQPFSL